MIFFRGADKLPEWSAEKCTTAIEGPFCKVTSTVGVIFAALSAFQILSVKAWM